jgi:NAD(P)-dependent dehydrogenase (short-subunit alcohol dehydrogenase family)
MTKKNIVLVGAAGLIGKAIYKELVSDNINLVAVDINEEALRELVSPFRGKYLVANITSEESMLELTTKLKNEYKIIDAVVNTSYPRNINLGKDLFDVKLEDFNENHSLHLGGYFNLSQKFAALFMEQGLGSIVNFSSIYGVCAPKFDIYEGTKMTNGPEYASIKSSLLFLTKFFSQRIKGSGVRINAVSPGGVLDGQPESFVKNYKEYCNTKGMLDPKDLVGAVRFLISDESKYVTGQNIIVDDGFSI